jgi:hypothetical protein
LTVVSQPKLIEIAQQLYGKGKAWTARSDHRTLGL